MAVRVSASRALVPVRTIGCLKFLSPLPQRFDWPSTAILGGVPRALQSRIQPAAPASLRLGPSSVMGEERILAFLLRDSFRVTEYGQSA